MSGKITLFSVIIGLGMLLPGCSSTSKSKVAVAYHNFHAYFNAYYNADQRYQEAVRNIEQEADLPTEGFMVLVDAAAKKPTGENERLLDEAIKKCETILFRRRNSGWLDDARFLIGRCWYYKGNTTLAMQNFDYLVYIHKQSELIPAVKFWQAKVYYNTDNLYAARAKLQEAFKAGIADEDSRREAAMLLADIMVKDREYSQAIKVLDDNLATFDTRRSRARVHFLLGQLYDQTGFFARAYGHLQAAYDENYSDALNFRAQLGLIALLVKYQPEKESLPQMTRLLNQLLDQSRYQDYQDQIYYQFALLALKDNAPREALGYLKQSIARSKDNKTQKALSYYKAADLYFNVFHRLARAQAYYDSAAKQMPDTHPDYKRIRNVALNLQEYVGYRTTIAQQDSLLQLAGLSPQEQAIRIDEALDAEDAAQEAATRQAQDAAQRQQQATDEATGRTTQGSGFYFDNPQAVSAGRTVFAQRWGTRPNEDNWRRTRDGLATTSNTGTGDVATTPTTNPAAPSREQRRIALRKQIPIEGPDQEKAHFKLGDAMMDLAALFADRLEMPDSARATYLALIDRYPRSLRWVPRAYYALAQLERTRKPNDARQYAEIVLAQYPQSEYARLLRNAEKKQGQVLEVDDFETAYNTVFGFYQAGEYQTTLNFAQYLLAKQPAVAYVPKLMYLKGLAYQRLGMRDSMVTQFTLLIKDHPQDPASQQAQRTLDILNGKYVLQLKSPNNAQSEAAKLGATPTLEDARLYNFTTARASNEGLMVLMLVDKNKIESARLLSLIQATNRNRFGSLNLNTNIFNYKEQHLVYIMQFASYKAAYDYLSAMRDDSAFTPLLADPAKDVFFISPANFRVAFTQRKMAEYQVFYEQNLTGFLSTGQ